jgi:hypothetical protein
MNSQGRQEAVTLFQSFTKQLAEKLPKPVRAFFLPLLYGALLAIARRRTVTTWLRAAQISDDYRSAFYHMPSIGRKTNDLLDAMTNIVSKQLRSVLEMATYIRIVLDDTPTKRYGKHIEGAGYHYNPTPGKTNATKCFGHSWVVAVLVVAHPLFGEISFPIAAELYLRQKEIDKLKDKYKRKFKKKTGLVVEIIKRLVPLFQGFGKEIEIIVDGGYAKDTVLLPLGKLDDVITITRLRCDAALYEVPPTPAKRGRGRPKKYGNKIDVKSMVASSDGWQIVECRQYGQIVQKRVKSFVAASKLTKGKAIKVVLIKENDKTCVSLMSTDAMMEVKEILEAYGVRFGIEEMFKDLKDVWGWGKQEVRLLERNEAVTAMNMLSFGLTELATWDRDSEELVDRRLSPWDDPDRRPSHADRRNFLRQAMLENELNAALGEKSIPQKIILLLKRLIGLVA